MTHSDLVDAAARWLQNSQGCAIVITEMAHGGGEEADAIGWLGAFSTVVECKATRSDFAADRKKMHRRGQAMGCQRFYFVPRGLVKPEEIPPGWGLLELRGSRVFKVVDAPRLPPEDRNWRAEMYLLTSCLRRLGVISEGGVSVRIYTQQTQRRATLRIGTDGCREDEPQPSLW